MDTGAAESAMVPPAGGVPQGGDLHFICKNCCLANAGLKCICVFFFKCSIFLKDIVSLVFILTRLCVHLGEVLGM